MTSVNIQQAAKQLHRHPATIRKWIRLDGAPVVELGRSAKGHGSLLVDPQQLAAWYAARHLPALQAEHQRQELAQLALWFLDAMKRDSSGLGFPAHEALGLKQDKAAAFAFLLCKYFCLRMQEHWPTDKELPEAARQLFLIASANARD